jgi:hypothetical protein
MNLLKQHMKQTDQLKSKDIEDYIENYTNDKDETFKFTVFGEFDSVTDDIDALYKAIKASNITCG